MIRKSLIAFLLVAVSISGCKTMNKTKKGAVIGAAGGAAAGGIIGRVSGNTALGAIIGATVGGVTGAVIGRKMDKQAEEIARKVPDARVERVGEGIVVEFNEKILFEFSKSELGGSAEKSLDKLSKVLEDYPDTNIEVQGHTDSRGTDEYNQGLSERRAEAVAGYLRGKGLASARITTKGFGEKAPAATNESVDGMAQNRRVDFLITANEKMKAEAKEEAKDKK